MFGKFPHPGGQHEWQMPHCGALSVDLIPTPSPASPPPGGLTLIGALLH